MLDAFESGDVAGACAIHLSLLPVIRAQQRLGGVIFAKAAIRLSGHDMGDPRLPLPPATEEQIAEILHDLKEANVPIVAGTWKTSR
jgi:4-hydroxy-tetrahydrodipicolinate synthase